MKKIVIFGNSGSGKSTLALRLSAAEGLSHLDLDSIAWLPEFPPERRPIAESRVRIEQFMKSNKQWVIEGCYSDLLEIALPEATEIIYLNLPIKDCIANARDRPWEPHKYESQQAQDANLDMLIDWIAQYPQRQDTFSQSAHEALFENYDGRKTIFTCNSDSTRMLTN